MIIRKYQIEIEAALIAILVFICTLILWDTTTFYLFQLRDINRAKEIVEGKIIFFGPEATGGGRLPGSFYYFLLALPLSLGFSWKSCWYLMMGLYSLSPSLIWIFFRRHFSWHTASVAVLFFLLNYNLVLELQNFWNPSYLGIFILISLFFVSLAYHPNNSRPIYWILACLFLGLSLQIHFTALFIFIAIVLVQFLSTQLNLPLIPWKLWGLGITTFFCTLLPYSLWLTTLDKSNLPPGIDAGVFDAKTFYNSIIIKLISSLSDSSIDIKKILVPFPVMPLLFGLLLPAAILIFKKKNPPKHVASADFTNNLIKIYALCTLSSIIPMIYGITRYAIGSRYFLIFQICLILLTTVFSSKLLISKKIGPYSILIYTFIFLASLFPFAFWKLRLPIFSIWAVFIFALLALRWKKAYFFLLVTLAASSNMSVMQSLMRGMETHLGFSDFQFIAEQIQKTTGWTYNETRYRLFYINTHFETTAEIFFDNTKPKKTLIDGYFIFKYPKKELEFGHIKSWLLEQELEGSLSKAIHLSKIVLLDPIIKNGLVLLPYTVPNEYKFARHFHNRGNPYNFDKSNPIRSINTQMTSDVIKTSPSSYSFQWNNSESLCEYCLVQAEVHITTPKSGKVTALVKIVGTPISQPSQWTSPLWTEGWIGPYIKVYCGNESQRILLAKAIGYLRILNISRTQKSFLAPFERKLKFSCHSPVDKIEMGAKYVRVLASHKRNKIVPPILTIKTK